MPSRKSTAKQGGSTSKRTSKTSAKTSSPRRRGKKAEHVDEPISGPAALVRRKAAQPELAKDSHNALAQPVQSMLAMFEPQGWAQALFAAGFSAEEMAKIVWRIAQDPDASPSSKLQALQLLRQWSESTLLGLSPAARRTIVTLRGKMGPDGKVNAEGATAEQQVIIEEGRSVQDVLRETERGLREALSQHPTASSEIMEDDQLDDQLDDDVVMELDD